MTQERPPRPLSDPDESSETVQLLVADAGNRSAISRMLDEQFDVKTSQTVTNADLYLIEDHLFPEYRAKLRERIERDHPAFCPVVLIQRENTNLKQGNRDPSAHEGAILYDEVVDAPINPPQLIRRLHSLLVRRRQSRELLQQVSTLEEREQRLRLFEQGVESTGNGIVMTDSAGTIEYVNPALESIAGYPEDDVLGKSPQILLPEGAGDVFEENFWQTLADQTEWQDDIIIERKNSHRRVVNATATALRSAEMATEGFVIVFSDITERIQREQDLEDREEELDLLRQILTRYLRHNLKNKLNIIEGNAQMLVEGESLSPEQVKMAETIVENSEDLLEKSETARSYSSLLGREAALSPFDLVEITTNAVQNVRKSHPDADFEIDAPETCEIRAREGIQRALEELIDNAARYNDAAESWVRIQVRDREGARLTIEDNGPGISNQERDSLESGTETQLSHSQGAGLWLSKWVIEGVDGRLSIELTDPGTRVIADFPPTAVVGSTGLEVTTLKEREQRLQTITDRMTDAILEVDADWKITQVDERAERILDVDADAVIGRSLWKVFPDLRDTRFEAVVSDAMESRTSTSVEEEFEGIDAWLEINVYPEFDGGLSFYTRDVTERNAREQTLETERRKFESLAATVPSVIYRADPDTMETVYVNDHIKDLHGFPPDEWVGNPSLWEESLHSEDRREVMETFRDCRVAERPGDLEYRILRLDGAVRWVRDTFSWERDQDGSITALVGVFSDITERKERERALQERVKELSAIHATTNLFQTAETPMDELLSVFVERLPQSLQYPDVAEARLRYDGTEVSTVDFESRDHVLTAYADLEDGSEVELAVGYTSDSRIHDDNPFLAEEEELLDTLITVVKNHVQRRTQLAELRRTEALLTNAERLGVVGAWEVDLETNDVFWTDGTRRIYGVSEEFELTPETAVEFFHSDDRETVTNSISACSESGDSFALEVRIQTSNGDERWVHIEGEPLEMGGSSSTVRGYIQDITDRKERNLRYDAIFNQTYQFTGLMEPDGTLIEANDSALEFGGITRADVLGKKVWNAHWFEISEETQRQTEADVRKAAAGEFVRRELEVQGADGTAVIDFSIRPVTDDDGTIILLVPEGRDISELKQREREIKHEHARFKAVFEESFDAMVLADDDGRYIDANESASEMFGLSEDELLGRSIAEFAPADFDFAAAWQEFQESEDERGTFPLVRPDGEERVVEFAATPNVVPGQHLSILRDITEWYNEERKREQIISRVTDAIVEVDSDWRFTLVNEQAEDLYGMDEESLLGRNFWSVFEDAKGTTFEEEYREVMESREPTSFVEYFSQLDGWFDIKAYPKDDGGIAFYFVEVTEQYKRERELAEKTRQLESIVQNTEEAIYIKDSEGYYQFINESGAAFFDMSAEEVIGKHDEDLFDEESVADIRSEDEQIMESSQAVRKETVRYIDGEKHVFLDAKYPHRDEVGEVIGLIGISLDISEQMERQNRLKQDAARLDALFEQSPDMINIHDLEGNIIDPNPGLCEETGYDEEELTDMKVWHLDQAIDPDELLTVWEGMELGDRERLESHYLHRDGSTIPVEVHIRRLNLAGEPRFMVISRNIAERKGYELAIEAQNERLKEFTSVVSHDLRSPLHAAEGWLDLVQEECDSEHMERLEGALDRMDALIGDLRTLAREGDTISDFESVDIAAMVEGCWVNVETADATLVTDSDRAIYADKSRLKQVFENLVHNAVEHGGDAVTVTIGEIDDGFYVEDDGPGIPEEDRGDVWESGYSECEDGTGFGLSIVKQIVDAHGWDIRITDGFDGGARYEITGVEFTAE